MFFRHSGLNPGDSNLSFLSSFWEGGIPGLFSLFSSFLLSVHIK